MKRVFLIVLDSFGIGELPDANKYGDSGSHTLRSVSSQPNFYAPNLTKLGLFNIEGSSVKGVANPVASYGRLKEASAGKDTTTGHWEIAGAILKEPFPTYPNGFSKEILDEFSRRTGRGVLCNLPYSGTKVLEDYGEMQRKTGSWIVYTSADSVFQVAADEDLIPVEELYQACRIARELLSVGRVIARPYTYRDGIYQRTARRHDFSLQPPETMLDVLQQNGYATIGIGKIYDIFAGKGISESLGVNEDNDDGMRKTDLMVEREFEGLCFVNLVDFDMKYGHRNDAIGYARAISEFDAWLGRFLPKLKRDDLLMITADHGCDPCTPSTDHSREYIPLLTLDGKGKNFGTRETFADISATILDYFSLDPICGTVIR